MNDTQIDKLFKNLVDTLKSESIKCTEKEDQEKECEHQEFSVENLIARIQLYHDLICEDYRTIKTSDSEYFDHQLSTKKTAIITMESMIDMHKKVFESFIQTYEKD